MYVSHTKLPQKAVLAVKLLKTTVLAVLRKQASNVEQSTGFCCFCRNSRNVQKGCKRVSETGTSLDQTCLARPCPARHVLGQPAAVHVVRLHACEVNTLFYTLLSTLFHPFTPFYTVSGTRDGSQSEGAGLPKCQMGPKPGFPARNQLPRRGTEPAKADLGRIKHRIGPE